MNWIEASAVHDVLRSAMNKCLLCIELLPDGACAVRLTPLDDWGAPPALITTPAEGGEYIFRRVMELHDKASAHMFGIHGERPSRVPLPLYPTERK